MQILHAKRLHRQRRLSFARPFRRRFAVIERRGNLDVWPLHDGKCRRSDLQCRFMIAPMFGVELKIAIAVLVGIVLTIGVAVFVRHLINR